MIQVLSLHVDGICLNSFRLRVWKFRTEIGNGYKLMGLAINQCVTVNIRVVEVSAAEVQLKKNVTNVAHAGVQSQTILEQHGLFCGKKISDC